MMITKSAETFERSMSGFQPEMSMPSSVEALVEVVLRTVWVVVLSLSPAAAVSSVVTSGLAAASVLTLLVVSVVPVPFAAVSVAAASVSAVSVAVPALAVSAVSAPPVVP